MRRRRLLVSCIVGVAMCLVFVALQQSPPSNDLLILTQEDGIITSSKKSHKRPSQYQSLRYLVPVEQVLDDEDDLFDQELSRYTKAPKTTIRPTSRAHLSHRRHKFARRKSEQAPNWRSTVYYNHRRPPAKFKEWNSSKVELCSSFSSNTVKSQASVSRMTAYGNLFAELSNVVVDRQYFVSDLKGGEMIEDVVGQDESAEYYRIKRGCFRLKCPKLHDLPFYNFDGNTHLDEWYNDGIQLEGSVVSDRSRRRQPKQGHNADDAVSVFDEFTVAVVRYEYANLFHTTTDWYNAFVMMQFFGRTPADTNILIVDAHPFGALDSTWTRLFGSVTRLSALKQQTRFRQLVWNIVGYESPMKIYADSPNPPLFEQFRSHVLSSYNIEDRPTPKTKNCSALVVLFIWRHDYLAHPRNPSGKVQRKIANERELVEFVQRRNAAFSVSGVQIDLLDFGDQLRLIVNADIVIGVHGAGLTHAAFMRGDAGLGEISPNEIWAESEHFKAIAGWRGLHYIHWTNHDFTRENDELGTVKVPPYIANALVNKLAKRICHKSTESRDKTQSTSPLPGRRRRRGFSK